MKATVASSRELRKGTRYSLKKTALFSWALQNEEPHSGQGVTRDVDNSGVYVLTDELPQVGALVQLDILIPELPGAYLGMHLLCDGVVIRVEQSGTTRDGFAASVHYYSQRTESACESSDRFSPGRGPCGFQ